MKRRSTLTQFRRVKLMGSHGCGRTHFVLQPESRGFTSQRRDSVKQSVKDIGPLRTPVAASVKDALGVAASLRLHWPEYLMEAGEMSLYLFCTCSFATLLQHPASPVRHFFVSGIVRRALMGLAIDSPFYGTTYSTSFAMAANCMNDVPS